MKHLLLTLILFADIHPLLSMELPSQHNDVAQPEYTTSECTEPVSSDVFSNLPPITLPQIYHHLADALIRDVAQHIFSLLPGMHAFENADLLPKENAPFPFDILTTSIEVSLMLCGHCFTVELFKRMLLRKNISIYDIKGHNNSTILHHNPDIETIRIILEIAGNNVWTLLITQTKEFRSTALHLAAQNGHIEIVKLLLDAADNNVQILMNIQNVSGKTAFDIAAPEVKKLMQRYLK